MDFDLDGQMELVTGFEDGTIEVRKHKSGEVLNTVNMPKGTPVSKLFYYDYRMMGSNQLIALGQDGKV